MTWQVKTDQGLYSLKLLSHHPARSLFSIWAQAYLVKKKARIPPLIPNTDGKLYVEMWKRIWIVAKWITPLTPVKKDLKGAKMLCQGLGEFHKLSRGYIPPPEARFTSNLSRWPNYYQKIISKFNSLKVQTQAYQGTPGKSLLISALNHFENQARKTLKSLWQSPYPNLAACGEVYWGFVHGDYGWGNAQLGPGGICILDLDDVTFDLPIRDLRRLISRLMTDLGRWDLRWIKEMIKAYHRANPLNEQLYKVLLVDLSMPHEFYQLVKELLHHQPSSLNYKVKHKLKTIIKLEKSKQAAVKKLSAWKVSL